MGTWTWRQQKLSLFFFLSVSLSAGLFSSQARGSLYLRSALEGTDAGRKQEPAPHLGYYHSGRTFLIAEDVKEEEEGGGGNISNVASCVIAPKPQGGSEREKQEW